MGLLQQELLSKDEHLEQCLADTLLCQLLLIILCPFWSFYFRKLLQFAYFLRFIGKVLLYVWGLYLPPSEDTVLRSLDCRPLVGALVSPALGCDALQTISS